MSELLQTSGYRPLSSGMLATPQGVEALNSMFRILFQNLPGDTNDRRILYGYGTPEGNVTAGIGAIYMRLDGGAGTAIYAKESGSGNTGWVAMDVVGVIPLSRGGLGVALSDPNADRILFWDDGADQFEFLTVGDRLTLSGTNLSADNQNSLADSNETINVTETGDLTVSVGKSYRLSFALKQHLSNSGTIFLRFNNNSSTNYGWQRTDKYGSGTVANQGNNSDTEIEIASVQNLVANNWIIGNLNITSGPSGALASVFGGYTYNATTNGRTQCIIGGEYGGDITSVEFISSQQLQIANTYLYEFPSA